MRNEKKIFYEANHANNGGTTVFVKQICYEVMLDIFFFIVQNTNYIIIKGMKLLILLLLL